MLSFKSIRDFARDLWPLFRSTFASSTRRVPSSSPASSDTRFHFSIHHAVHSGPLIIAHLCNHVNRKQDNREPPQFLSLVYSRQQIGYTQPTLLSHPLILVFTFIYTNGILITYLCHKIRTFPLPPLSPSHKLCIHTFGPIIISSNAFPLSHSLYIHFPKNTLDITVSLIMLCNCLYLKRLDSPLVLV